MPFNVSFNVGFLLQTEILGQSTIPRVVTSGEFQSSSIGVTIFPRWYKQISLEWSVPAAWGNCMFNVYFSQTNDGPWELVNPAPITGTFLTETSSRVYSKYTHGYYIVEVALLDKGSAKIRSTPHTWVVSQDRWVALRSNEIQRREYLLLSRFVGVRSYLFRRKTYGVRCPNCWSTSVERIVKDHCLVCMGTGFDGGYFDAAPLFIQYDPTPNDRVHTYFGTLETNQITGWTVSLPDIRNDDIIVRTGDWNVYLVNKVADTELQANAVKQTMVLNQLAKENVEYNLVTRNLPDFPTRYL
jgi:hypothetical protein